MLLSGCSKKTDVNTLVDKPNFAGIINEVSEGSIIVIVNEDEDEIKSSDLISVSLDVELKDRMTDFEIGDEVRVYYDGNIAESYPAQINKVYAIVLENRTEDETVEAIKDADYYFEPSVSTIEGTLITRMYYGPPGYGENPDTDPKEYPFILQLDEPIDVIAKEDDIYNSSISEVTEIQVVPLGKEGFEIVKKYINKHIKIQGSLFTHFTGHHHTDILIEVEKVLE